MKKMISRFPQIWGEKKWTILALVTFFFASLGSINAQYVGKNTAVKILKNEITLLDQQASQTSNTATLMTIKLKHDYFLVAIADIESGKSVNQAIHDNRPRAKPSVHPSGLMVYSDASPGFKQEVANLITYTEELLKA